MIERKFVSQNMKEFLVKDYLFKELSRVGLSNVTLQRTPLGEKVIISASRPGLVVGKGGSNIARLTKELQTRFELENPQIEIEEVTDPRGNAAITAEMIANSLERFGSARFKGVGHKAISSVIDSGSLGVEILISGKIPSSRAKTWRFYQGYLKKCGDIAVSGVDESKQVAKLKTGIVGIQVKIMPNTTILPDKITVKDLTQIQEETITEEVKESKTEETKESKSTKEETKEEKTPKKTTKKTTKKSTKKTTKKEEADEQ
ncbi:30S ribosomal protein S3 [Candidatus Woesearchaeota archaeon]|nr:30S ribosomal protein S3 [Candidatus Woesearchaeota archaeon]